MESDLEELPNEVKLRIVGQLLKYDRKIQEVEAKIPKQTENPGESGLLEKNLLALLKRRRTEFCRCVDILIKETEDTVTTETFNQRLAEIERKLDPDQIELGLLVTKGLGRAIFQDFVGADFKNLRLVAEHLESNVPLEKACVMADRKRLEIKVFACGNKADRTREVFDQNILPLLDKLRKGDGEIPLKDKHSFAVRVIIGCGGEAQGILFRGQYRSIFVDHVPSSSDLDVEKRFLKYGTIKECTPYSQQVCSSSKRWGHITFESHESAQKAFEDHKNSDAFKVIPQTSSAQLGQFAIRLSWTRRHLSGFGFITLKDLNNIDPVLRKGYIEIDGIRAELSRDLRDRNNIYIRNLPKSTTETEVSMAIQQLLAGDDKSEETVQKVILSREKPVKTPPAKLISMKKDLEKSLSHACGDKMLSLVLDTPSEESVLFKGSLHFTDPNKCAAVYRELKTGINMNGKPVQIILDMGTNVSIPDKVLAVCQTDLAALERKLSQSDKFKNVTIKHEIKDGHCYVRIMCECPSVLLQAKQMYYCLLAGTELDLSTFGSVVTGLFTREGRRRLNDIEKSSETVIRTDYCLQRVFVIGAEDNYKIAFDQIKEYLQLLTNFSTMSTPLSGANIPAGLTKTLLENLDKFREETGIETVRINFTNHMLITSGTQDSQIKAKARIDELIGQLQSRTDTEEDSLCCVVCFCPIQEGQLYRLGLCGHPYCLQCIKAQMRNAIDQRDLPLTCVLGDCRELWCWKDVDKISRSGDRSVGELAKVSADIYIQRNKDTYDFCLTPDCTGVFPVSSEGKLFICEECQLRICTSCKSQYHAGLTCAMFNDTSTNTGLSEWFSSDREVNKWCPKCEVLIQKDGGCFHVYCSNCKIDICWLCMKTFSSSSQCYQHLREQHGRISDEYPLN